MPLPILTDSSSVGREKVIACHCVTDQLFQAQYLQEVLLRISSLLDNLHLLSQMHDRLEGKE